MLYIFDLHNVIINVDDQRALGVWSKLSGTPLAILQSNFTGDETLARYETGALDDTQFANALGEQLEINLGFQQFVSGWQAVMVKPNRSVLSAMQRLRTEGHRVAILANTNPLHWDYLSQQFPEIIEACDTYYLSYQLKARKPAAQAYQLLLDAEQVIGEHCVLFDSTLEHVEAAREQGITAVWVNNPEVVERSLRETSG